MNIELIPRLSGQKLNIWKSFLERAGLEADTNIEETVLVWDGDELVATGSRQENLLKCIAVESARQGEGLTATVITSLRRSAFEKGFRHLFLYTKPMNKEMFASLFFYPVAQTDKVLLMENKKDGIAEFLDTLPVDSCESCDKGVGAVVMNCNPFTLGHRYLIETAAKECDRLYVFVLSEDKSMFSAEHRLNMVIKGTADLENVSVLPTGPYLISAATFPTYFLKDRESADRVQCMLDIEIFTKYFVPRFGITRRFVGTEPLSQMTDRYNDALKQNLPLRGIELTELPRLETDGKPVSASAVRKFIEEKNIDAVKDLVPHSTFEYLQTNSLI